MVVIARSVTIFKGGQVVVEHGDGGKDPALSARIGRGRIRRYELLTGSSLRRRLGQDGSGKAGVKSRGINEWLENGASRAMLDSMIKLASAIVPPADQI